MNNKTMPKPPKQKPNPIISLTGGFSQPGRKKEHSKQNTLEHKKESSEKLDDSFDVNDR